MSVDSDQVLDGAGAGTADGAIADEVLAEANAYVANYIATNLIDATNPVPDEINDAAVLVCAVDLFGRRKAPFGQQIMTDLTGTPISTRIAADPMATARAKLRPWCFNISFSFPLDDE